ncbi:MAG: hypothetical protein COA91_09465 [Robiginitomaculum sp.]|nr:MAG: hypothetical protein COA91_09465 [Robiginitomaculum sp.]
MKNDKPTPDKDKGAAKSSGKKKPGLLGKLVLPVVLGLTSFSTVYVLPRAEIPTSGNTKIAGDQSLEENDADPTPIETSYINLEPFTVSLKGRSRILRLNITLEVPQQHAEFIDPQNPKLRDAFMGYLSALGMAQIEDAAFLVRLRAQLTRRANFVLGPGNVQNILITDFMVR